MEDYNRRFGREPLNSHDAHRPLLAHEDLMRVFTWQEERRLTDNLTLHYKRVMYIVEPCAAADAARGKRVLVVESEDGTVRIEHNGAVLAARAFQKDARVHQAAIVENKVLADALVAIRAKQQERDEKLKRFRRTLREKDHFQKTMEPAVREKAQLPTVTTQALLRGALAWAQEFASNESVRRTAGR